MEDMKEENLLSFGQTVRQLDISESTLRLWTKQGKIKSIRNYRGWRFFHESEVARVKESLSAYVKIPKKPIVNVDPQLNNHKKSPLLELFRVAQGISLTKLSAQMGVSWTRIRKIFEGSPMSEGESEKLKEILGIDLTLFGEVSGDEKAQKTNASLI
jgi:DNA-binding Xre family transcriptional regulator